MGGKKTGPVDIGTRSWIDGALSDCYQYVGLSGVNLDWGQVIEE